MKKRNYLTIQATYAFKMAGQQICLKWNSFQTNIVSSFENLWEEEGLVDVTLASDGQCIRAHKVILSACSPFFRQVFQSNPCQHPVIILQDVHFSELESLLCFVYKGEVNIGQENLPALLKAAETLQIRGLSGASEQVKEKMAIPRKAPCAEGAELPLPHPPAKRHKGCGTTTPPPTIAPQQHQPPPEEGAPCIATPPLALSAKTTSEEEEEGVVQGEGTKAQASGGESMAAAEDARTMMQEGGFVSLQEGGSGGGEEGEGGEGEEEEEGGIEEEEEDEEDRPLAHLSLKMEPPEFDYPCDSNSLPLALTLTLPNSAEEINLPSMMSKTRRASDCHSDASLLKAEDAALPSEGNNGVQTVRRRSRGVSAGGSGARRKRRHCNNFIWRTPACGSPLLPQVTLGGDAGCTLGAADDGTGGVLLLAPPHHGSTANDLHSGDDEDAAKKKPKQQQHGGAEQQQQGGAEEDEALPPYSLLPHACLLPAPSILSAWAKARTPEQLSCDLMRLLFSTEERLVCNVNGKMGKRRFDAHKVLLIREVVRHHYNECSAGRHGDEGADGEGTEEGTSTDFEERWKGCVTRIDTANRGLKRNLVLRGRKASFLV